MAESLLRIEVARTLTRPTSHRNLPCFHGSGARGSPAVNHGHVKWRLADNQISGGPPMPWYDDPSKTQFTGSYSNEKQYRWDLEAAAKRGWTVQPTETEGEEPVIGEQPKTRLTVTFVRREDWLASRKEEIARSLTETASRSADEKEARHVKAADELRRSEEQLDARIAALSTVDDSGREQAERDVLGALKEVMLKRRNALRAKDEAIKEMDAAVA